MNKDDLDFLEIDQLTYAGASDSRTCTSPAVLIHTQTSNHIVGTQTKSGTDDKHKATFLVDSLQ